MWPPVGWQTLAEVAAIIVWALWVGRSYLDFSPYTWPSGEFGTQVQTHHLWTQARRCGLCALWNGGINGGAPALADLFGSMLHPLVIATTLLWGVVPGAKVAVVAALALGGIAQWWIARVLRLGQLARVWSALLAVASGHLAGKMDNGNVGLVLSTAACSLALAGALDLATTPERRATLLLALMGALALVSGQGYLQLALLFWAPAFLFFILDAPGRRSRIWREYVLAAGLAILLAGVFLIPLLHFWPHVHKDKDATFSAAQPLAYVPLNLVIRDTKTIGPAMLGQWPYPYMYNLYIGWVPVVLALLGLRFARREDRRGLLCLASGAAIMFFIASAVPFRWLYDVLPNAASVRHTPLMAGLAVPAILGLAAYGLDRLAASSWPQLELRVRRRDGGRAWRLDARWVLSIPLVWSLATTSMLARNWLKTTDARPLYDAVAALRTPNLAWVAPPYGELRWTEPALHLGLKLSPIVWVFRWRDVPMPYLEAVRDGSQPAVDRLGRWQNIPAHYVNAMRAAYGLKAERAGSLAGVPVYRDRHQHYAAVVAGLRKVPCQATGSGGDLTVTCTNEEAGYLTVQENAWSGWTVRRDGVRVPLEPGPSLRVVAPAGHHRYTFQYRPWDVLAGLASTMLGSALTLWLWVRQAGHHKGTKRTRNP